KWTPPTALSGDARSAVQAAVLSHIDYRQPVLPGSTPLLAGDLLVYRSSRGLHAVDPRTGRAAWDTGVVWGIDQLAAVPDFAGHLSEWVRQYLDTSPHV